MCTNLTIQNQMIWEKLILINLINIINININNVRGKESFINPDEIIVRKFKVWCLYLNIVETRIHKLNTRNAKSSHKYMYNSLCKFETTNEIIKLSNLASIN